MQSGKLKAPFGWVGGKSKLAKDIVEAISYDHKTYVEVFGGAMSVLYTKALIIDKQLLDHINSSYKYTEIVQVFGESMEPDIKDGSLVFVDKSKTNINTPGVYLISTSDGLYIKQIKIKYNKYYLYSTNKEYKEIQIDKFEVVGRVKGVFINI